MYVRMYLDFEMEKGSYSVWSSVTSMLGWFLDFRGHDDNTVGDREIITL